jgi:hypothetical protein
VTLRLEQIVREGMHTTCRDAGVEISHRLR